MSAIGAVLSAALLAAMPQSGDTIFAARGANSLDVELGMGSVVVRGWDRDDVRIVSDEDLRQLEIDLQGDRIDIESDMVFVRGAIDLEIDVPDGFQVRIEGMTLEVHVEGVSGYVDVESLAGGVTVLDTEGDIDVETLAGAIRVENSRGDLDLSAAGFAIRVVNATGEIDVESVGGGIELIDVRSPQVDAASLGGRITYEGSLSPGGSYYFESHGGPIDLVLDPGASASFDLDTMMGNVDVDYPGVTMNSSHEGHRMFTVGGGSAEVSVETFSGRVRIRERGGR